MASRIFAVLAAIFLIGAFAVATLGPPNLPLGQALFMIDHDLPRNLEAGIRRVLSSGAWNVMALPLLLRPAWLIPAALGLIFAGLSVTLTSRPTAASRRR